MEPEDIWRASHTPSQWKQMTKKLLKLLVSLFPNQLSGDWKQHYPFYCPNLCCSVLNLTICYNIHSAMTFSISIIQSSSWIKCCFVASIPFVWDEYMMPPYQGTFSTSERHKTPRACLCPGSSVSLRQREHASLSSMSTTLWPLHDQFTARANSSFWWPGKRLGCRLWVEFQFWL